MPIRGRFRLNSEHAQRAAALNGIGIGLLPEVYVRADLSVGALVRVLTDESPVAQPVHVLMLPNRRQTAKIRSFLDFLMDAWAA